MCKGPLGSHVYWTLVFWALGLCPGCPAGYYVFEHANTLMLAFRSTHSLTEAADT